MASSYMTSTEVCRYMNCSVTVLNRLEREGLLKPRRQLPLNRKRLYVKKDVDAYLNSLVIKKESSK